MNYWNTKHQRLATYREAKEECERELALLERLIQEEESEPTLGQEGDLISWIDYRESLSEQEEH
jgi:hypothetical protein